MDGIDISYFQLQVPPGQWLFIVHKATEGTTFHDPDFAARFPTFPGLRGAYHYARPLSSGGTTQANFFADTVLAAGFKPGVDLWQLDVEGAGNYQVSGPTWRGFIDTFMAQATARLGARGFLYVGAYFFHADIQPERYHWWLPDYGPNDGQLHPLPAGLNPVVHQYTSAGNLDRNVVHDQAAWDSIVAPPPPPVPVQSGGITVDFTNVKAATIELAPQGFGLFKGAYDLGAPVAECQATVLGPAPAVDGWWNATAEGLVRAQARDHYVIVTGYFPRWQQGDANPQVHVLAIPA